MSPQSPARGCVVASCAFLFSLVFVSVASPAQSLVAPQLIASGRIYYDALGMPTVQAATDNDAAFLQGYAHAENRFFQMDLSRRQVSGTLAALVGPSQLANDVQSRTLGLRRAAVKTWAAMSDDMRGWLAAYANGVNYWLATNPLPPEYAALDLTKADPWSPVDSIAVGKGLAFQLSFDLDIDATIAFGAYQQAAAAANVDPAALFFGDTHRFAPPDDRITLPDFMPSGSAPKSTAAHSALPTIAPETLKLARAYRAAIEGNPLIDSVRNRRERGVGSNEWVIGPGLTASGKAILSNDPHLGLGLPAVFIEMHLVSAEQRDGATLNVTGVSVPGAPGIIQGCNSRVCWGTTTNPMDVTDVFQETFKLDSLGLPVAIVHDGADEPVQWVFQSYYVNQLDGTPDHVVRDNSVGYANGAITIIVPRRNDGPVVQIDGNAGLSIAYTGSGATNEIECFRRIDRARNLADFQNALSYFDVGSQNFAYADVDGNIAYFTSAENPIREDLQNDGAPGGGIPPWLIRDGSGALHHDWLPVQHPQPNQAIPYEIMPAGEMPHAINPAQGWFANANNDPIGTTLDNNPLNQLRPGGGLYYLGTGYSAYRIGRIDREIRAMVAAGHAITADDMKALQANDRPLDAELLTPYLIAAYDDAHGGDAPPALVQLASDPAVTEAINRLRNWDYSAPTGIAQGYDPGDDPNALPSPSPTEIDDSVATTIFMMWRSYAVRDTIDATLTNMGLGDYLPSGGDAYNGLKFLLDNFDALQGSGLSGVPFFNADQAAGSLTPTGARDYVLLTSLREALTQLASADLAPAFRESADLSDYRWGKLHRVVFTHPLGPPFDLPGQNGYGFTDVGPDLPGFARAGGWQTVDPGSNPIRAFGLNDFMFNGTAAPGRRFVGEMTSTIGASEVIPGGNSGVLGSPHYADQLALWLTDHYHPLAIPASAAIAASVASQDFVP